RSLTAEIFSSEPTIPPRSAPSATVTDSRASRSTAWQLKTREQRQRIRARHRFSGVRIEHVELVELFDFEIEHIPVHIRKVTAKEDMVRTGEIDNWFHGVRRR